VGFDEIQVNCSLVLTGITLNIWCLMEKFTMWGGMNKEIEEIIVKTFFIKKIQQRVQFELSSNKKRLDRIARIERQY
jgi:hypothetical protein